MRALLILFVTGMTVHAQLRAQAGGVSGTLEAEQTGERLGNVLVYLAATTLTDTTAPDGSFRIDSVPPGHYALAWYHSLLDAARPVPIRVESGRDTTLTVRAPLLPVIAAGCPQGGGSAVWGRVVAGEAGVPMSGVRVELRAEHAVSPDSAGPGGAEPGSTGSFQWTRSEPDGAYRFCGLSAGSWRVAAGLAGADRLSADVVLPEDAAVRLDLSPALPGPDSRGRIAGRARGPGEGMARVVGAVISDAEGEPVAGALVQLGDSIQVLTDYRGRFLARDISQRLLPLRVSHAGFDPVEDTVVVRPGELTELEVRLGPVTLDPILVTARRRGILTDVYWRANQGLGGIYMTADEIDARAPARTIDVVRSEPSVRVFGSGSGLNGQLELRGGCAPHVYLDGIRITTDRDVMNPTGGFTPGYRTEPWALADAYRAVNLVHPSSIEIIEIYRSASEVPPEFGGSLGMCGAIGIWTRRGGDAGGRR